MDLPIELIFHLLDYLDVNSIIHLGQVNSFWYQLITSRSTLSRIVRRFSWLHDLKISNWSQFLSYYDSSYYSARSARYLTKEQCKRLAAKHGHLLPGSNYQESIIIAAKFGHSDLVQHILTQYPNTYDYNLLMVYAARHGQMNLVARMLEYGATSYHRTLEAAARYNHLSALLQLSTFSNLEDELAIVSGAARGGYLKSNHPSYRNQIMQQAAYGGHLSLVRSMRKHGATNINSSFLAASNKGHLEIMIYLLSKGASSILEATFQCALRGHRNGLKILPSLTANEYKEVVVCILTVGSKYISRNPHLARVRWLQICKFLLRCMMQQEASLDLYEIPLILIAEKDEGKLLNWMFKHEIRLFEAGMRGAAKGGHLHQISQLLALGATNRRECTIIAARSGHFDIVTTYWDPLDTDSIVQAAIEGGHIKIVEWVHPELQEKYLLLAVEYNHSSIVEYFLDRGATNIDAALIIAAREGYLDLVERLLQAGAKSYSDAILAAKNPVVMTSNHPRIISLLSSFHH